jgi:Sec-independent protein translocase protein TatA
LRYVVAAMVVVLLIALLVVGASELHSLARTG